MKRNTINMSITVDKDLKEDARILFNKLGLSMSGAISLFLKQAVREEKIPFEISLKLGEHIGEVGKIGDQKS